jgi:hypothetical protein
LRAMTHCVRSPGVTKVVHPRDRIVRSETPSRTWESVHVTGTADLQWRIQGAIRCTLGLARADRCTTAMEVVKRFRQPTTIVAVHEAATHTARRSATATGSAWSFRDRRIGFSSW